MKSMSLIEARDILNRIGFHTDCAKHAWDTVEEYLENESNFVEENIKLRNYIKIKYNTDIKT